jgi:hypothetical protein
MEMSCAGGKKGAIAEGFGGFLGVGRHQGMWLGQEVLDERDRVGGVLKNDGALDAGDTLPGV